jgi:hypothetical protein
MAQKWLISSARIAGALAVIAVVLYFVGGTFYTRYPKSYEAIAQIFTAIESLRESLADSAVDKDSLAGIGKLAHAPQSIATKYGNAELSVSDDGQITVRHGELHFTSN